MSPFSKKGILYHRTQLPVRDMHSHSYPRNRRWRKRYGVFLLLIRGLIDLGYKKLLPPAYKCGYLPQYPRYYPGGGRQPS